MDPRAKEIWQKRLEAIGLWKEFSKAKESVRKEKRSQGIIGRGVANSEAWKETLEKFKERILGAEADLESSAETGVVDSEWDEDVLDDIESADED